MINKYMQEINEKLEILNKIIQDNNYFIELEKRIDYVNNHSIELQQRIDKAIEWVHKTQLDNKRLEPIISTDELDDILDILRGDSDE